MVSQTYNVPKPLGQSPTIWYYPPELYNDLDATSLPRAKKDEALACAWEYARCVIPQYTNSKRYTAFMRLVTIAAIAEFRGDLFDITASTTILGHDIDNLLHILFEDMVCHQDMAREYKTFLVFTSEKSSGKLQSKLFRRYVDAMVSSPETWFRIRDCDALARFTLAAALACNDQTHVWFSEPQLRVLCEIGCIMYDAVAFYKHRAEGETHSTFAYMPEELRIEAYREAREVLWALDLAMTGRPGFPIVTNFFRFFGGPIHMMMRRYRFVEEDLTIGKPEDKMVIEATRKNTKLWNRLQGFSGGDDLKSQERYEMLMDRQEELLFPGLPAILRETNCARCVFAGSSDKVRSSTFSGAELCEDCKDDWRVFLERLPERVQRAFLG